MDNLVVQAITEKGMEVFNRYYSVYRAKVLDNRDPDNTNKLLVWVPEIFGGIKVWAYPRGQYGGFGYGIKPLTPLINEVVYVSFEYGDPNKALWEPHGWGIGESLEPLNHPAVGGLITPNHNMIYWDERDNSLHVNFNGPVYINSAKEVVMISEQAVSIKGKNGVVVNGGKNGGVINIKELTEKLNQLIQELEDQKNQLNACINLLNTHTHNCTAPGSPSGPNLMQMQAISTNFSKFNKDDYEDVKNLH